MTRSIFLLIAILIFGLAANAQTTEFTYQGNLKDGAAAANANYDFEFALFDSLTGGTQQGSILTRSAVAVSSGAFSVKLDFGSQFPGAGRFLEIHVRPTGSGTFTVLAPRQQISNTPYSMRSLNATSADTATTATNALQLGGVASNQYVLTGDVRLSDARNPLPNSPNYVQNQNSGPQPSSNFNISGNGTLGGTLSANTVTSSTQFNIGPDRVLSAPSGNLFAGPGAGAASTGDNNAFFGNGAGLSNNSGLGNSFFGRSAGVANTGGQLNSFFGGSAGLANTGGSNNTLIGALSNVGSANLNFATAIGSNAIVGASNTIVLGRSAGQDTVQIPGALNVTGPIIGNGSGLTNVTAQTAGNVTGVVLPANGGTGLSSPGTLGNFLKSGGTNWVSSPLFASDLPAGSTNYIQNGLSFQSPGNFSISGNGTAGGTLSSSTVNANTQYNFAGARILSAGNNNISVGINSASVAIGGLNSYFGLSAGQNSTSGQANSYFGSNAGQNATGSSNSFFGDSAGRDTSGSNDTFFGEASGVANVSGGNNTLIGANTNVGFGNLTFATAIGSGSVVSSSNRIILGRSNGSDTVEFPGLLLSNNMVQINALGTAGVAHLCSNVSNQISFCSSSLRYKTNIAKFSPGLAIVKQLRPITFDWKQGGMKDVGFGAEDVAKVDPLFVTYNDKGEVEGVKYDRLSAVFVNAFKEQQTQIERQQKLIDAQQKRIDTLAAIVCSLKPGSDICKQREQ